MLRIFLLLSAVVLHSGCEVQASVRQTRDSQDSGGAQPFDFNLLQSCDDWVIFVCNSSLGGLPASLGHPSFFSCEITYMDENSQVAKLVMVTIQPELRTVRLSMLSLSTRYAASMICNDTLTSNTIQFVTGYPCSEEEMKEHALKIRQQRQQKQQQAGRNGEVSQHPVIAASDDLSVMDVSLGVFFAMFGVVIITVFAYYIWRKHHHRQRIQRIFGQSHSEPFLALHTPSDQSTVSF